MSVFVTLKSWSVLTNMPLTILNIQKAGFNILTHQNGLPSPFRMCHKWMWDCGCHRWVYEVVKNQDEVAKYALESLGTTYLPM
jgi:hypothetical protein